jgi:hypothetical protein
MDENSNIMYNFEDDLSGGHGTSIHIDEIDLVNDDLG